MSIIYELSGLLPVRNNFGFNMVVSPKIRYGPGVPPEATGGFRTNRNEKFERKFPHELPILASLLAALTAPGACGDAPSRHALGS
jgi:hypothetical protein